jgi:hypothetical protein
MGRASVGWGVGESGSRGVEGPRGKKERRSADVKTNGGADRLRKHVRRRRDAFAWIRRVRGRRARAI